MDKAEDVENVPPLTAVWSSAILPTPIWSSILGEVLGLQEMMAAYLICGYCSENIEDRINTIITTSIIYFSRNSTYFVIQFDTIMSAMIS